jgi:hypothetical protein
MGAIGYDYRPFQRIGSRCRRSDLAFCFGSLRRSACVKRRRSHRTLSVGWAIAALRSAEPATVEQASVISEVSELA